MKDFATQLLLVFLIALVGVLFFRASAKDIEAMKVGGIENYNQLQILYKSDAYKKVMDQNLLNFENQLAQSVSGTVQ